MKLKLNTAQQSSLKLVEVRLHLVVLNKLIVTKEFTCKILSLVGYKANLSPAKLKLADIGLELSLAICRHFRDELKESEFATLS